MSGQQLPMMIRRLRWTGSAFLKTGRLQLRRLNHLLKISFRAPQVIAYRLKSIHAKVFHNTIKKYNRVVFFPYFCFMKKNEQENQNANHIPVEGNAGTGDNDNDNDNNIVESSINILPDEEESITEFHYKRGDCVHYLGGIMDVNFEDRYVDGKFAGTKVTKKNLRPVKNTFVWAFNPKSAQCIIQHPDGVTKEHFFSNNIEEGEVTAIKPRELKDGLLYIYCDPEDLEFVSRKED